MGITIKDAVTDIANKLQIKERDSLPSLSQWLYIFTKGYVSNLRSRRALPNDYWTAETVEDYMRCKVINFPIGVHNEEMRRDAFRTWIISRKLADEREKDKKNLFVCTYNPTSCQVNFVKNFCLNVDTKVETLGLLEHINLGTVKITDQFFNQVTFGTKVAVGDRIFIRRIFPIQSESDEKLEKLIVTEAKRGENLTHIDDCHVLVIQEGGQGHVNGLDYDKYIISKIREITVRFEPRPEPDAKSFSVDLPLDPKLSIDSVLSRLSESLCLETESVELYKCYSTKSMMKRPAEFPVELATEKNLESLLEWCKEGMKTVFYRLRTDTRKVTPSSPAQRATDHSTSPPAGSEEKAEPAFSVEEDIMDTA